ncbi:hypothetical protein [Candidatus Azobacteroides pseudotrichonymphae]|uniref:Uncharacterized protein n=1 Tax=Azobacteroides pseudotrichonymphae genomovar. CFP2 TaxID=511995 RepID=B6YS62_AZOPC|nr:hypothetical protein [Candidatus Azobacteroides pseudotrichonymphae]BAG84034.1 hypothetical protein CFPG_P1-13 [Candidatus Azobacteroides pseudotrichonymphae genomovar. CFP2]
MLEKGFYLEHGYPIITEKALHPRSYRNKRCSNQHVMIYCQDYYYKHGYEREFSEEPTCFYDEMKKRLYHHLVCEGRTLFMGSPMGCFYMSMHNDVPMVSREGRKVDAGNSFYRRRWRLQIHPTTREEKNLIQCAYQKDVRRHMHMYRQSLEGKDRYYTPHECSYMNDWMKQCIKESALRVGMDEKEAFSVHREICRIAHSAFLPNHPLHKEAFFSKKTSIRHPGVKLYCIALWRPIAFRTRVEYMNKRFGMPERTLSLSGWNYEWKLKDKARQLEG